MLTLSRSLMADGLKAFDLAHVGSEEGLRIRTHREHMKGLYLLLALALPTWRSAAPVHPGVGPRYDAPLALSLDSSISFFRHSYEQTDRPQSGHVWQRLALAANHRLNTRTPTIRSSHLLKVFHGFEVESLFVQQLQVLVVQLVPPHLVLLLLLLQL